MLGAPLIDVRALLDPPRWLELFQGQYGVNEYEETIHVRTWEHDGGEKQCLLLGS